MIQDFSIKINFAQLKQKKNIKTNKKIWCNVKRNHSFLCDLWTVFMSTCLGSACSTRISFHSPCLRRHYRTATYLRSIVVRSIWVHCFRDCVGIVIVSVAVVAVPPLAVVSVEEKAAASSSSSSWRCSPLLLRATTVDGWMSDWLKCVSICLHGTMSGWVDGWRSEKW